MIFLYDPLLTSIAGNTIGHRLMGLTVRKFDNPYRNISLGNAILRFSVKALLGWISFLTITGNKYKRAIHDMVGNSIVICRK